MTKDMTTERSLLRNLLNEEKLRPVAQPPLVGGDGKPVPVLLRMVVENPPLHRLRRSPHRLPRNQLKCPSREVSQKSPLRGELLQLPSGPGQAFDSAFG